MGNASGLFGDIGFSDHFNLSDGHLPLISNETNLELIFTDGLLNVISFSLQLRSNDGHLPLIFNEMDLKLASTSGLLGFGSSL
jgi:hypothetical protein